MTVAARDPLLPYVTIELIVIHKTVQGRAHLMVVLKLGLTTVEVHRKQPH